MNIKNTLKQVVYRFLGIILAPFVLALLFVTLAVLTLVLFAIFLLGWTYASLFSGWSYLNEI